MMILSVPSVWNGTVGPVPVFFNVPLCPPRPSEVGQKESPTADCSQTSLLSWTLWTGRRVWWEHGTKRKSGRGGQEMSCASGKLGLRGIEGGASDGLAGEHTDVNISPHSSGAATSCQRSHTRSCPFSFASFKEPKIPTRWWWTVFLSFHDGVLGCPVGFVILVVSERAAAFFMFLFPFPLVCKIIVSWWLSEHTPAVFFCFFREN